MTKILHIASFIGNIGDNASHMGFKNILDELIEDYSIEKVEIRKFYKSYDKEDKSFFDEGFINYLNSFDICFIGGGGFLDYWIPNSKTGTTIDINPQLIKKIKIPTLFTSIGANPHKNVPKENIIKFQNFLNEIELNQNTHIFLRNDGSIESIKRDIGEQYLKNIYEILDHGFFYKNEIKNIFEFDEYVSINITVDQLVMNSKNRNEIDKNMYYKELSKVIDYIVNELELKIVLIPHIHSDIKAIDELFSYIDDMIKRRFIIVAPYIQGDYGANLIFSIYKNSKYIIASRLHANICNIAMKKNTIGLQILDRVKYVYDSFSLSDNLIDIHNGFSIKIIKLLARNNFISNEDLLKSKKKDTIKKYKMIFDSSL